MQKIADYFVKNMKRYKFKLENSFESKIENSFQKLKLDTKNASKELFTIKKYAQQETDETQLNSILTARRSLVDQLALAAQLVKRERIKRSIIERINN